MFLNTNSIIINNISIGQYITQAEYQYPKLWGSDTGRNLAGAFTGTLLGIFPKIILTFRKLTQAEIEILAPILDSANQTLTYYDPVKKANVTLNTYTGDWSLVNKSKVDSNHKNEGFQISFISKSRRV